VSEHFGKSGGKGFFNGCPKKNAWPGKGKKDGFTDLPPQRQLKGRLKIEKEENN